jgi:ribonuclease HI
MNDKLIIYTDGGARGNPGPAAAGFVIKDNDNRGHDKGYGEFLGKTTNNVAEYMAIILALKKAKVLLGKSKAKQTEVELRSDSELATRQLNGQYKIENEKIQPLFLEVWNLRLDFKSVKFIHIRREENKQADAMVNKVLDNEV